MKAKLKSVKRSAPKNLAEAMGEVPPKNANLVGCIGYSLTTKDATESWRVANVSEDKPDPNISAFLTAISRTLDMNPRTISFSDVLKNCAAFEMDTEKVLRPLWTRWSQHLLNLNRLEIFPNIYDDEMFLVL
jgi:hypothetical protein